MPITIYNYHYKTEIDIDRLNQLLESEKKLIKAERLIKLLKAKKAILKEKIEKLIQKNHEELLKETNRKYKGLYCLLNYRIKKLLHSEVY